MPIAAAQATNNVNVPGSGTGAKAAVGAAVGNEITDGMEAGTVVPIVSALPGANEAAPLRMSVPLFT
jgi:hypothetical protein